MEFSILEQDALRTRWHRFRAGLALSDPSDDAFGRAGLASNVEEPSVRLLILPRDPEADVVRFDKEFWEWWLAERNEPATGRPSYWLTQHRPTADAAVRYSPGNGNWERYLALRRGGALEIEGGVSCARTARDHRYFLLINSVGHIWYALNLYRDVVERFSLAGPWEVSLALCNTADARVTNVAKGWNDPFGFGSDTSHKITAKNLMYRKEVSSWLDLDGIKEMAYRFGDWMEDAWGSQQRRYRQRTDNLDGEFDATQYG